MRWQSDTHTAEDWIRQLRDSLNVNWPGLRLSDVSHVGSGLAGLEWGVAAIGLGDGQVSLARGYVGTGAWLCCRDHTPW